MLPPNHFLRHLEAAGTGGAQKCRGSGAPNRNRHPNQPPCHAMQAAARVFDVVEKFYTVATNFLKLLSQSSANWVAFWSRCFGCRLCCRGRQDVHWQWAIFGLGSDTWIQIYGDWLKDKLLGLLPD